MTVANENRTGRASQKLCRLAWRAKGDAHRFARAWSSVVLGLLDAPALDLVTVASYRGKTGFESGQFNITHGLWPREQSAIDDCLRPGMKVLVAGVGGGREAIALAHMGCDVVAFDGSAYLASACARNAERSGVKIVSLHVPYGTEQELSDQFDALLVGRGVYHHISGRARRVEFLRACRALLVPGGVLIMGDVLVRHETSAVPDRAWLRAARLRRLRGAVALERGDSLTSGFLHRFTRDELEAELADSGLEMKEWREHLSFGARLAHVLGRASSSLDAGQICCSSKPITAGSAS